MYKYELIKNLTGSYYTWDKSNNSNNERNTLCSLWVAQPSNNVLVITPGLKFDLENGEEEVVGCPWDVAVEWVVTPFALADVWKSVMMLASLAVVSDYPIIPTSLFLLALVVVIEDIFSVFPDRPEEWTMKFDIRLAVGCH